MTNKNTLKFAAAIFLMFGFESLSASILFDVQGELLKSGAGAAIGTNSLVMLVADTTRNGFATIADGSSLALNSSLNSGDDLVVARWNLSNTATAGVFADTASLNLGSGWDNGDPLALLWFPTLTTSALSATGGTSYGMFSGPALDGSDAWTTPTDGTNGHKLWFFTTDGVNLPAVPPGSNSASLGNASLSVSGGAVVPEPSRAFLMAAGLGVMLMRRRRW